MKNNNQPRIDWTDLVPAINELRALGTSVNEICRIVGVSTAAFEYFRRRTGFQLDPIQGSNNRLINRRPPPERIRSDDDYMGGFGV